jgi:hypothetical protein
MHISAIELRRPKQQRHLLRDRPPPVSVRLEEYSYDRQKSRYSYTSSSESQRYFRSLSMRSKQYR